MSLRESLDSAHMSAVIIPPFPKTVRYIRFTAVRAKLGGISKTTLYGLMKQASFPRPIKLSRRLVIWNEVEIDAWIQKKKTV